MNQIALVSTPFKISLQKLSNPFLILNMLSDAPQAVVARLEEGGEKKN